MQAGIMSLSKSLKKGSECPPLEKGHLRLYSMRFCPYAQRARLVLSYYNIPCEIVNINLVEKPEWFWRKNPDGTVPVLESDGKLVSESDICAEYLDEVYGKCQLMSIDPYKKAHQKMLLHRFSKFTGIYYGALKSKSKEELKNITENIEKALMPFENELHGKYFGGDLPNLVDLLIWPWFERLPVLKKLYDVDVFQRGGSFPKLSAWTEDMGNLPAVKACRTADDLQIEFIRQYFDPNLTSPDYDLGLTD